MHYVNQKVSLKKGLKLNSKLKEVKMAELTQLQLAIIGGSSMVRVLQTYSMKERSKTIDKVYSRIMKMQRKQARLNPEAFFEARALERAWWTEAVNSYDPKSQLYVIDTVMHLYGYFDTELQRYADLSEKLIDQMVLIHDHSNAKDKNIEQNDQDLITTYIKILSKYTGKTVKRSFGDRLTSWKGDPYGDQDRELQRASDDRNAHEDHE